MGAVDDVVPILLDGHVAVHDFVEVELVVVVAGYHAAIGEGDGYYLLLSGHGVGDDWIEDEVVRVDVLLLLFSIAGFKVLQ